MKILKLLKSVKRTMLTGRGDLGDSGAHSVIGKPVYITSPKAVHMEDNAVIRIGTSILNDRNEHVYIGKFTVVGLNCTIVTNGHRSTVGVPHTLLGASHINDKSADIHIEEDVWIGANVTILAGANLGRGCIAGACSTISKPVPPYALVVGTPAKIVGVKFSIDQILEHERILYPENERFSREYLEELFETYYQDKKVFGVSTEFTEEHMKMLERGIQLRGFKDDEYLEKFRAMIKDDVSAGLEG